MAVLSNISVIEVRYPHIQEDIDNVCEVEYRQVNAIVVKSNHSLHVHIYEEDIKRLYQQIEKQQQYEV